jgi:protein MpaA
MVRLRRWVFAAAAVVMATAGCGAMAHGHALHERIATRPAPAPVPTRPAARVAILGRSVRHRLIRAVVVGPADARRSVLVVGCVHGDERAGEAVTRTLRSAAAPPGVALWLVDSLNPDGCRAHTRQNAHGVDLNRNSPWHWRALDRRGGMFWAGPRAASEPETQAIMRLVRRVHPAVSVWYHQHAALVDDSGGSRSVERRYAHLVGLPFRHYGNFSGSLTSWQDAGFPSSTAFVVELSAGRLNRAAIRRHAHAVLALAAATSAAPR